MSNNSKIKKLSGRVTADIGVELHLLLYEYLQITGIKQKTLIKELIRDYLLEHQITEKSIEKQQKTSKDIKVSEDVENKEIKIFGNLIKDTKND